MEIELRDHLFACARAFGAAKRLELSTIGKLAAGDGRFFENLNEGSSFTARKYDAVIRWFSLNWPQDVMWPESVPQPGEAAA